MTAPSRQALFFGDHFITTPVPAGAQLAIERWAREHIDSLAEVLAAHNLTPSDIRVPQYERVVYRDEIDPQPGATT